MVDIDGAPNSIYAGEKFQLRFKFNNRYPFDSPEVSTTSLFRFSVVKLHQGGVGVFPQMEALPLKPVYLDQRCEIKLLMFRCLGYAHGHYMVFTCVCRLHLLGGWAEFRNAWNHEGHGYSAVLHTAKEAYCCIHFHIMLLARDTGNYEAPWRSWLERCLSVREVPGSKSAQGKKKFDWLVTRVVCLSKALYSHLSRSPERIREVSFVENITI